MKDALELYASLAFHSCLSAERHQDILRKSVLVTLDSQHIELSYNFAYLVLEGWLQVNVKALNGDLRVDIYQRGKVLRLLKAQGRKTLQCSKVTRLVTLSPFVLPFVEASPILSCLPREFQQFLSTLPTFSQYSYGSRVCKQGQPSTTLKCILEGEFIKEFQKGSMIMPAGQQFGEEGILNQASFSITSYSQRGRVAEIPIREIKHCIMLSNEQTKIRIGSAVLRKIDCIKEMSDIKKNIERQPPKKQNSEEISILPKILANSHLLMRTKVKRTILRARLASLK